MESARSGEPVRGIERTGGNVVLMALQKVSRDSLPERMAKNSARIKNTGDIAAEFGIGRSINVFA